MKKKNFCKELFNRTAIKYLLSYLIILSVLLTGFYFTMKTQLTDEYYKQLCVQAEEQMEIFSTRLNDDIVYLYQINKSMVEDIDIVLSRYKTDSWGNYETMKKLKKYDVATKLVDSVVYWTELSGEVLSTLLPVEYIDGSFHFQMNHLFYEDREILVFDPEPYLGHSQGQLVFLSDNDNKLLLFFPGTAKAANYRSIFVIDINEIEKQISNLVSDGMPALALVSPDHRIVVGVETERLLPYMEKLEEEEGIYDFSETESLCVKTGIGNGYMLVSLISSENLREQINSAFSSSYGMIFLLGLIGFVLIFLGMRITWLPLHRLTGKIVSNTNRQQGYIKQIEDAFSGMEERNEVLKSKLDKYRRSMQKALLESTVVSAEFSGQRDWEENNKQPIADAELIGNQEMLFGIDQLFEFSEENDIFIVVMKANQGILPCEEIRLNIQELLQKENVCYILESDEKRTVFLLNYIGSESQKAAVLKGFLTDCYESKGYFGAISSSSKSALDIPSLYRSALAASELWPDTPVADDTLLLSEGVSLTYPHEKLKHFTESLKASDFIAVRNISNHLFDVIGTSEDVGRQFQEFFIKSILVDILAIIASSMDKSGIKFKVYSDLYFETLYYCRSCSYKEKETEIRKNIMRLIDTYEEEINSRDINAVQIRGIIEAGCCHPDFSITLLAEHFHVGVAYMSYLVKKELSSNFSDYLWMLRLEKAQNLLRESQMTVDEISVAVGYLNASSFRRKFKQCTGLTPSQYRDGTIF